MSVFIALAAVLAVCLFLVRRLGLPASAAPFTALTGIVGLLCLGGMADLLRETGWAILALALALGVLGLLPVRRGDLRPSAPFFSPGMVFFLVSSLFFFLVFTLRSFWFRSWDEFSFWGTAAKSVFANGRLYTVALSSVAKNTYPPAMPVLAYFFQFWAAGFREGYVYLASDILLMSAAATVFGTARWREVPRVALTAAAAFLLLYLYSGSETYCTSYADIPMGAVIGAVLCIWFACAQEHRGAAMTATACGLFFLSLTKTAGAGLGVLTAVVLLLASVASVPEKTARKGRLLPALLALFPVAGLLLWKLHLALTLPAPAAGTPYAYSFLQIFGGRDPFFGRVLAIMWQQTVGENLFLSLSLLGSVVLLVALPLLAALLADKAGRRRLLFCAGTVLLLSVFWFFSLAYSYTAVFSRFETSGSVMPSYLRYCTNLLTAFLFWELALLTDPANAPRAAKGRPLTGFAVCAAVVLCVLCSPSEPIAQRFITSPALDFSLDETRMSIRQLFSRYTPYLTADDRIYFEAGYAPELDWFKFSEEAMPAYTVTLLGNGHFVPADTANAVFPDTPCSRSMFVDYLLEQDVGFVFVFRIADDYYMSEFGPLYTDGLAGALDKSCCLYRVVPGGEYGVTLEPVPSPAMLDG